MTPLSPHGPILSRDDGYRRWRDRIPFTDEQIIVALLDEATDADAAETRGGPWSALNRRKLAEHLARTHRLSRHTLSVALPRLVKICSICGKVAHYRIGVYGRCAQHKTVPTEGLLLRKALIERKSTDVERVMREETTTELRARRHHAATGRKNRNRTP